MTDQSWVKEEKVQVVKHEERTKKGEVRKQEVGWRRQKVSVLLSCTYYGDRNLFNQACYGSSPPVWLQNLSAKQTIPLWWRLELLGFGLGESPRQKCKSMQCLSKWQKQFGVCVLAVVYLANPKCLSPNHFVLSDLYADGQFDCLSLSLSSLFLITPSLSTMARSYWLPPPFCFALFSSSFCSVSTQATY